MNKYYNKVKTAIYNKQYRENNREHISKEKQKCYALHQHNKKNCVINYTNTTKLKIKLITCECGKISNLGSLIKHRKSPFHDKMMKSFELYFN